MVLCCWDKRTHKAWGLASQPHKSSCLFFLFFFSLANLHIRFKIFHMLLCLASSEKCGSYNWEANKMLPMLTCFSFFSLRWWLPVIKTGSNQSQFNSWVYWEREQKKTMPNWSKNKIFWYFCDNTMETNVKIHLSRSGCSSEWKCATISNSLLEKFPFCHLLNCSAPHWRAQLLNWEEVKTRPQEGNCSEWGGPFPFFHAGRQKGAMLNALWTTAVRK